MMEIEVLIGFQLPTKYKKFLTNLKECTFEIDETDICLYNQNALVERNNTYDIQKDAPNTLLIAQDGDLGFYICKDTGENIFSLGLGCVGVLDMTHESDDIDDFINTIATDY